MNNAAWVRAVFFAFLWVAIPVYAQSPGLPQGNYPMLRSTSDTTTFINALVSREKEYGMRAIPANDPQHAPIEATPVGQAVQDPERQLHRKAIRLKLEGVVGGKDLDYTAVVFGTQDEPFFSYGNRVTRGAELPTRRRQILNDQFQVKDGKVELLLLDADDTVRIAPSKGISATAVDDVMILPNVAKKIGDAVEQGKLVAIVSNQGGVAAGKVSWGVADGALQNTLKLIAEEDPRAKIHYYDMAERGPADYYSKPNIGMGTHLERVLKDRGLEVDWLNSMMVGDAQEKKGVVGPRGIVGADFSDSDRVFADNLRIRTQHPKDFFGWTEDQHKAIRTQDLGAIRPERCGELYNQIGAAQKTN